MKSRSAVRLIKRATTSLFFVACAASCHAQNRISLLPLPAQVVEGTHALSLDASFSVQFGGYTEPRLQRAL